MRLREVAGPVEDRRDAGLGQPREIGDRLEAGQARLARHGPNAPDSAVTSGWSDWHLARRERDAGDAPLDLGRVLAQPGIGRGDARDVLLELGLHVLAALVGQVLEREAERAVVGEVRVGDHAVRHAVGAAAGAARDHARG